MSAPDVTLEQLRGQVVHIGSHCGVQFAAGRDLIMRVGHTEASKYWDGMAYLTGYVLGPDGNAVDHRQVYVIVAGLAVITPRPAPAPRMVRAARNTGPAAVPRPRTPTETHSGRTR